MIKKNHAAHKDTVENQFSHENERTFLFSPGTGDNPTGGAESKLNIIADLRKLDENRVPAKKNELSGLQTQNKELRRPRAEAESRSIYATFHDFTTVGYFIFDEKGIILDVNLKGAAQLSMEISELIRKPLSSFIVKEDQELFDLHQRNVLEKKTNQTCEIRLKIKDGAEMVAELESTTVQDSSGSPRLMQTIVKDMTRIHKAHSALQQKDIALREMIEQIHIEKNNLKEDMADNINNNIMPILSKIELTRDTAGYKDLLKYHLEEIASSFGHNISKKHVNLTLRETEICNMIRGGLSSKEICNLLNVSDLTIEKHRRNIRKKLGLSNRMINLASYLRSL